MCRVHALTPFPTAGTWTVCVRAGIHTLMNIWRVFVLVVGALLLPLAAAGDGPANKVGISRGYGTLHCADRGGRGTGIGNGACTSPPCYMAAVKRIPIFTFTTNDGGTCELWIDPSRACLPPCAPHHHRALVSLPWCC